MGFCSFLVQLTPWELVAGVGASAVLCWGFKELLVGEKGQNVVWGKSWQHRANCKPGETCHRHPVGRNMDLSGYGMHIQHGSLLLQA